MKMDANLKLSTNSEASILCMHQQLLISNIRTARRCDVCCFLEITDAEFGGKHNLTL
jgi:hypothetical protein